MSIIRRSNTNHRNVSRDGGKQLEIRNFLEIKLFFSLESLLRKKWTKLGCSGIRVCKQNKNKNRRNFDSSSRVEEWFYFLHSFWNIIRKRKLSTSTLHSYNESIFHTYLLIQSPFFQMLCAKLFRINKKEREKKL